MPQAYGQAIRLRRRFTSLRLNPGEDPTMLPAEFERIAAELELLEEPTNEKKVMATLLNALPRAYDDIVETFSTRKTHDRA